MSTGSGSALSSLAGLGKSFYPVYRRLFSENSNIVRTIDQKLKQARIPLNVELYMSQAIGVGMLVGFLLSLIGAGVGFFVFVQLHILDGIRIIGIPVVIDSFMQTVWFDILLAFLSMVIFGLIGFALGMISLFMVPYARASSRRREINMILPDAVSYMYALSTGGLNQLEVIEAMAKAEDTYGEVAEEFQNIIHESEYFETDYRTAIRNQAQETPSTILAQFLTDMLSIIDSGGDLTRFLEDQKDKHMRTAQQEREETLDTLELFGEMYMTLSMFPLLLIIVFVIMGMLPDANVPVILYMGMTIYGLIPVIGFGFLVLVATVKQDEPGDGYLSPPERRKRIEHGGGVINTTLVERFTGEYSLFGQIKTKETFYQIRQHVLHPLSFFKDNPLWVLLITFPLSMFLMIYLIVSGSAPLSLGGLSSQPVWGTFVYLYLPIYVNGIPLMIFYEWNVRDRNAVTRNLSDNLRQLASANNTGQTLLQSLDTVASSSEGLLAREFDIMARKVHYGTSLEEAMIEFNNRYHIPRLARMVKLITKAEQASSHIAEVLTTAAQSSENTDEIERERKSRTRLQVAIIIMTYLALLGVMAILKTQFIDTLATVTENVSDQVQSGGGAGGPAGNADFGSDLDIPMISMMFFHAVTLQAIISGLISGYMRDAKLLSGVKYVVILPTFAIIVWAVVS